MALIHKMKASKQRIRITHDDTLFVDTSTLPGAGNGLFTKRLIKKNELICYFAGDVIDDEEADRRCVGVRGHYFVRLASGRLLDTYHSKSQARWVNDAKDRRRNNSKIFSDLRGTYAYISSIKIIQPGSEIFVAYGKQYWERVKI